MGIRTTQVIGLNEAARTLVEGENVLDYTFRGERVYADGRRESVEQQVFTSSVRTEETGRTFAGMFGEEYPLQRYHLADGRVLEEDVQAEPWSSGPCIFLALRERGEWVAETLWSDAEISEEVG